MEHGEQIRVSLDDLLRAALNPGTDSSTRTRFTTSTVTESTRTELSGGLVDREELTRIYRRRSRREGDLPAGTRELARQLEQEREPWVALFAISLGSDMLYVFARMDRRSLICCVVGQVASVRQPPFGE